LAKEEATFANMCAVEAEERDKLALMPDRFKNDKRQFTQVSGLL
jgi:hypothetical protein